MSSSTIASATCGSSPGFGERAHLASHGGDDLLGRLLAFCLHANETLSRLEQSPKLVVAALNGHTVGGGLEIAMAADIRIARRDAGRCGLPEVNLGVLPGTGGTQRLLRMVGKSKAIELMCSGRLFSFEEALDWGIINDIYDGDAKSFREQALDYCKQFTLPNKATKVVGNIKRSVQSGAEMSFESGLDTRARAAESPVRLTRRQGRSKRLDRRPARATSSWPAASRA
jgi:enoyl-CoA hydratase/carnithine racemase